MSNERAWLSVHGERPFAWPLPHWTNLDWQQCVILHQEQACRNDIRLAVLLIIVQFYLTCSRYRLELTRN